VCYVWKIKIVLGTSALLCCNRYNWSLSELISNSQHIKYFSFTYWHFNGLSDNQKISAGSVSDLIYIRDGKLFWPPLFFTNSSVTLLITCAHPD